LFSGNKGSRREAFLKRGHIWAVKGHLPLTPSVTHVVSWSPVQYPPALNVKYIYF